MSSVGVSKNNSKKIILCFVNIKHAKKALTSTKNLRKSSSPNCNVLTNGNLTVKSNEIAFLSRKFKRSGHLTKIYTRDGTVQKYTGKVSKIYHINDFLNLFPYYDFGENYRETDQNDSLQSND